MPRLTFENKITMGNAIQVGLLLLALVGAYFGIIGRADSQAKDISELQRTVAPIPQIQTDLSVLKSTITAKGQQRDAQIGSLERRVDQNQLSVEAKLDKIVDGMSDLSSQVSGLNATLRAQGQLRP